MHWVVWDEKRGGYCCLKNARIESLYARKSASIAHLRNERIAIEKEPSSSIVGKLRPKRH